MMRFPGTDYRQYICDPRNRGDWRTFSDGGVTRYILDKSSHDFGQIDVLSPGWEEVAILNPGGESVTRHFPDRTMIRSTIWNFGDSLEKLENLAKAPGDTVFVRLKLKSALSLYAQYTTKYAEPARWLYEIQDRYQNAKNFVIFGDFDFEFYFCLGLAGSGVDLSGQTGIYPHGLAVLTTQLPEELNWIKDRWPNKTRRFYAVKVLLHLPVYLRNFYRAPRPPMLPLYDEVDYRYMYFTRNTRVKEKRTDMTAGTPVKKPPKGAHRFLYNDGVLCQNCSLSYACNLYRPTGVCIVPGTEGENLVDKFKSKKASEVVDAVAEMVALQAELAKKSIDKDAERMERGETADPATNKLINSVISNGVALAKLRNPNLTRPMIAIQNNNGGGKQHEIVDGEVVDPFKQLERMPERELSELIDKMERAGWKREEIERADMAAFLVKEHQPQLENQNIVDGEVVNEGELPF